MVNVNSTSVDVTVDAAPTIITQPSRAYIESGQSITLTSTVQGGSGSFSWACYDHTGSLVGSGSGTTASQVITTSDFYGYYFVFTDTGVSAGATPASAATVTSNGAPVVVLSAPSVYIQPSSVTIDSGQSITLSSSVEGGSGDFSWQWYDQTGAIVGAYGSGTTASYTFSSLSSDDGVYVVFTDVYVSSGATPSSLASVSSSSVDVTVDSAPLVSTSLNSATIDSGQSITLTSTVSGGSGSFSWACYDHTGSLVGSGTGAFASQSVSSSDAGYYFVFTDTGVSSDAAPAVTASSNSIAVYVNAAPYVSIPPSSATIYSGQSANLTSVVSGGSGDFNWQWYDNSGAISGAYGSGSTAFYLVSSGDTGVYVVFTDTGLTSGATPDSTATASSNSVDVSIGTAPSISIQPSSAVIDSGQSITLTSTVQDGSGSFSWQWYDQTGALSDAYGTGTTATYVFGSSGNGTGIYVVFTDTGVTPAVNVASNSVNVTVDVAPSIISQPSSATIDSGQSITLTSTVSGGTGTFTWTCYTHTGTLVGSGSGQSASQVVSTADSGYYFAFTDTGVSSGATPTATAQSSGAQVIVDSAPQISSQPSSATIDSGQSITLTSTVTGGTGSFTWKCYTHTGAQVGSGSGTSASQIVSTADAGYYFVFTDTGVSSGATPTATAQSNSAQAREDSAPSVSSQPSSATIDSGQSITLTSTVQGGTGSFTWQWYNHAGTAVGSGSSGTTASLSVSSADSGYYVVFTDSGTGSATPTKTATSSSVQVTVDSAPSVSSQPSSATIDSGQSITLTSTVQGGTGSFTWKCYTHTGAQVGSGSGTSASQIVSTADAGYYFVFTDTGVSSGATPTATAQSNSAQVAVDSAPSIGAQPVSATLDSGQSITLSSTVTRGTGSFTWQWYDHNGVVTGASGTGVSASYVVSSGDTGIYVVFTDAGVSAGASGSKTATSSTVDVTMNVALTVSVSPAGPVTMNIGQTETFTANPSGGSDSYSTYTWYVNGISQSGYDTSMFNYTANSLGSLSITATVTDSLGVTSSQSSTCDVTVNDVAPTITAPVNVVAFANSAAGASDVSLGSPTVGSIAYSTADLSVTNNATAIFPVGTVTVLWTVTDPSGLTATALQTVIINPYSPTSSSSPTPTLTPTPTPTTTPTQYQTYTVTATAPNGTVVNVTIYGDINSSQISNMTISTCQSAATTAVSFTITGQSGTQSFLNMTISKNDVFYGTVPAVSIDGKQAVNQGYVQDANNYYVWFSTSSGTNQVSILFARATRQHNSSIRQ